jgi:hypothetical protein
VRGSNNSISISGGSGSGQHCQVWMYRGVQGLVMPLVVLQTRSQPLPPATRVGNAWAMTVSVRD